MDLYFPCMTCSNFDSIENRAAEEGVVFAAFYIDMACAKVFAGLLCSSDISL